MTQYSHQTAPTLYVEKDNIKYAYRRFGNSSSNKVPLLFLIHFRGNMDYWDPFLVNSIAACRPVILFDNAGVGKSTGTVPDSIKGMALHVISFLAALKVSKIDILGFSMGGYITPLVYLNAPQGLVRRLVVAGSGPSGGEGLVSPTPERLQEIAELAGGATPDYSNCFHKLFFLNTPTSQAAGQAWYKRIHERDESTSGETRSELVSYKYADAGEGLKAMSAAGNKFARLDDRENGSFDRLGEISIPTFIAQGKDDFMIPTMNSYFMQQKMSNARLKIFPDSGHAFLYQYAKEFAADVNSFLDLEL